MSNAEGEGERRERERGKEEEGKGRSVSFFLVVCEAGRKEGFLSCASVQARWGEGISCEDDGREEQGKCERVGVEKEGALLC